MQQSVIHILNSSPEYLKVVLETSKAKIARMTEQPSHYSGLMVMVHIETTSSSVWI
jgi:hypothetical protein